MKLKYLLQEINILENSADLEMEISDISYDSRCTAKGDVFVAIKGFESDGHKYVKNAENNGAVCIVCEDVPDCELPYIVVEDSRLALALMSKRYFGNPAETMKLIGVTGTNGKTTVTLLIKHMLERSMNARVGLIGTNANMIMSQALPTERTTPESYELQKLFREMADAGCTHVVMEVSSHSLTLHRVAGLRFEIGIFTNLTQDHLDFHGTMGKYAKSKAQLFSMCERGAVNLDDEYAPLMLREAKCEILCYSLEKNEASIVSKDIRLGAEGVRFCAVTPDGLHMTSLPIPGKFSVYNALSVISCGVLLGIDTHTVCDTLSTAPGVKGRVEVVPTGRDFTVIIDYAHTPDALENVLKSMKEIAKGRVVALFGCGGDRDRTKRHIMGAIAAKYADVVVVTSDNPRTEEPEAIIADIVEGLKGTKTPYMVIEDRRLAIAWAIDNARRDDIIVLAGKGHETYQIVGKEKHHMDEREIIAEHLERDTKNDN